MTRDHLYQLHQKVCKEALDLMQQKNEDYAYGEDPLANFRMFGSKWMVLGMVFRMGDKLRRLFKAALSLQFAVAGETVKDTCLDIINYAVLFLAAWSDSDAEGDSN